MQRGAVLLFSVAHMLLMLQVFKRCSNILHFNFLRLVGPEPLYYGRLSVYLSIFVFVCVSVSLCLSVCVSSVRLSHCLSVALADSGLKKPDVKIKFRPKFIALWTHLII